MNSTLFIHKKYHFRPASLKWGKISVNETFQLYMPALLQVMAVKVAMVRRWMTIPWSLKGSTLACSSTKNYWSFDKNESIFGFHAESSTFFRKGPKI